MKRNIISAFFTIYKVQIPSSHFDPFLLNKRYENSLYFPAQDDFRISFSPVDLDSKEIVNARWGLIADDIINNLKYVEGHLPIWIQTQKISDRLSFAIAREIARIILKWYNNRSIVR